MLQDILNTELFWSVLGGTFVALLALGYFLDPRYRRRRRPANAPTSARRAARGRAV